MSLNKRKPEREVVYHFCQVCGYVFDEDLPDECPVCRSTREQFKRVECTLLG